MIRFQEFRIGQRIYCSNFRQSGTVKSVSKDSVGTIVRYRADNGESHIVYAYMLEKKINP